MSLSSTLFPAPPRLPTSPYGVPIAANFHGCSPSPTAAGDKTKLLCGHPSRPWLASVSEDGTVCVWDWEAGSCSLRLDVEGLRAEAPPAPVEDDAGGDDNKGPSGRVIDVRIGEEGVLDALWGARSGAGDYDLVGPDGWVLPPPPFPAPSDFYCEGRIPPPPAQQWLLILTETRCLVVDLPSARLLYDVPATALRAAESGASRATKKFSIKCVACVGRGLLAFGCDDGCVRVWAVEARSIVSVCRPVPPSSGSRPVTHLAALCLPPHLSFGGGKDGVFSVTPVHPPPPRSVVLCIVTGSSDGTLSVWDVTNGGRSVAPAPRTSARPGAEVVEVTVDAATATACLLCTDRSVTLVDVASNSDVGGGVSRPPLSSRVGTLSPLAEGGAGGRYLGAASLSGHPLFPPGTVLGAGKGPHLELVVVGGDAAPALVYDLRTSRPGLPSKLKVYTLAHSGSSPGVFAVGTNVGVFVVTIAEGYGASATSVSSTRTSRSSARAVSSVPRPCSRPSARAPTSRCATP